jgi:hypothetical protein
VFQSLYPSRVASDDGQRIFFESFEALTQPIRLRDVDWCQTGLATTYSNAGGGKLTVDLHGSSIKYTLSGALRSAGGGVADNLHVEDLAIGVFVAGKQSEHPAEQPRFEGEAYPVRLSGEQDPANKLVIGMTGKTKLECTGAHRGMK